MLTLVSSTERFVSGEKYMKLWGFKYEMNGWKKWRRLRKKGVRDHFRNHFSSENKIRPVMDHNLARRKISAEDNMMLIAPFSEEEIKEAVWEYDSSKAPGPDGFNFSFIKGCWNIVGKDLCKMVEEFHRNGKIVRGGKYC